MAEVSFYVFEGAGTAEDALNVALKEYRKEHRWLDDVAVISRSKLGMVRVNSTWAQETDITEGSGIWGAMTGAIVGALFGPGGSLVGLISGSALGLATGALVNESVKDSRLDLVADALKKNTSVLVLVGDKPMTNSFVKIFASEGGKLIKSEVKDEIIERLKERPTGYFRKAG
ncbi:DUF1269 domain-containing protein, partial [Xanthovirga aplysinae]|uniref:DUF1269 domain-containing protein n=1 Tax=Xanthovirga aplysinae TaxID=2529853 RepID=UPI0012BD450F